MLTKVISTWRPLLPVVEDRPLAVCDYRSMDPEDLVAADRVLPDKVGEVYYIRHNLEQKWHWIEHQTSGECWIMMMYDTKKGRQAKCKFASNEWCSTEKDLQRIKR